MGGCANARVREHGGRDCLAAEARIATLGGEQREPGDIGAGLGDCERQVGGAVEDPAQLEIAAVDAVRASERGKRVLPRVRVVPGEGRAAAPEFERLGRDPGAVGPRLPREPRHLHHERRREGDRDGRGRSGPGRGLGRAALQELGELQVEVVVGHSDASVSRRNRGS